MAPEPRSLSTVDALAQLAFLVHGALERRAAARELSIVQIRLLGILRDRRPTMLELARLLGVEKSSATGLIDRAARRGLVVRVPSSTDRRAVRVVLTEPGRALGAEVAAGFASDVTTLLAGVPAGNRAALARLAQEVLVSHAAALGVDLFAGLDTAGTADE